MNQQNQGWMQQQALLQQQQQVLPPGYSQQALVQGGFVPHNTAGTFFPQALPPKGKRRPGTANRKAQLNFGKKLGYQPVQQNTGNPNAPMSAKAASLIDLEISRLRPKNVQQERERLYDDVMKQRMTTNNLNQENIKLKTRIHMIEAELQRKDRVIDDLVQQQEQNFGMPQGKFAAGRTGPLKGETHLVINLKRKIKELQSEKQRGDEEKSALERNIRSTRLTEIEVEVKLYMEECARLRHQLEEVIKSKDTFADPQELKIIEEKF